MFLMTVLYRLIKTATDSGDVLKYLTKGDGTALAAVVSRLLSYTPRQLTMKPEENDCKWHNVSLYQVQGRPDSTVQH